MTPYSLVLWYHIYRVEVNQVWNVAGYIEEWVINRPPRIQVAHQNWEEGGID
jgi:hypothetical protein